MELLANLYRKMFKIRCFEESLLELFSQGKLMGTTHTCIGQEACSVGVIQALDMTRDIIFSNHRGHGHFLAYCEDMEGLLNEIGGKNAGVCGGIGGSQHLHKNNFYSNGILGGTVAVATGIALAEKIKKSNAISVVFFGDGAMGEGIIYEAMNIAALWNLPILFVLEHNQYAQTTPSTMQHSGNIAERAASFSIKSNELEVADVIEVYRVAINAIDYVRSYGVPFFLTLHTYRLAPHSKGDDFRQEEELEKYRIKDPLGLARKKLLSSNIDTTGIENHVRSELHEVIQRTLHST
ncbi:MAG: thiamine pyrophosphate-dependent dehydrogenase E1 component subunit alpha [Desulfuromonadaceae bacterium]|nr:thiamine pyrophosphate-dependent dehydrogenase E1 component subunit alpha [Desulfuromonadaceae bacterium]